MAFGNDFTDFKLLVHNLVATNNMSGSFRLKSIGRKKL